MQPAIIRFADTIMGYPGNPILSNVNLVVPKGAFLYLMGKTGAGKSTFLKTLYAQLPPISGEAAVLGMDLHEMDRHSIPRLRRRLGIVFQDFNLLADRNVVANLDFVLKATGWTKKKNRRERIAEVLEQVDLKGKEERLPHQISGGEQQRLVIARALLNKPDLILADEPTGNLDEETAMGIMELILRVKAESQATIILATHNQQLIQQFPGQLLRCADGALQLETDPVFIG